MKKVAIIFTSALFFSSGAANSVEKVSKNDRFSVLVADNDILSANQVVKLTPKNILDAFSVAFREAGHDVIANNPDIVLNVAITSYDSGRYFGGAKTATIAVSYALTRQATGVLEAWTDRCQYKAKLDWQDSNKRNLSAVKGCMSVLSDTLMHRLFDVDSLPTGGK